MHIYVYYTHIYMWHAKLLSNSAYVLSSNLHSALSSLWSLHYGPFLHWKYSYYTQILSLLKDVTQPQTPINGSCQWQRLYTCSLKHACLSSWPCLRQAQKPWLVWVPVCILANVKLCECCLQSWIMKTAMYSLLRHLFLLRWFPKWWPQGILENYLIRW